MIVLYLLWAPLVWHGRAPQQCSRHVMISFLLFSLQFAYHGGVDAIRDQILSTESLSVQDLTSLFQPFGVCDEYINTTFFKVCVHTCVRVCVRACVCMCACAVVCSAGIVLGGQGILHSVFPPVLVLRSAQGLTTPVEGQGSCSVHMIWDYITRLP